MVILTISVNGWQCVWYDAITLFTISYNISLILVIPVESCWLRWSWLRFDYVQIILSQMTSLPGSQSKNYNWTAKSKRKWAPPPTDKFYEMILYNEYLRGSTPARSNTNDLVPLFLHSSGLYGLLRRWR